MCNIKDKKLSSPLQAPTKWLSGNRQVLPTLSRVSVWGVGISIYGGLAMRNQGQKAIYDQTTVQVEQKEWAKESVKRDAQRFEQYVQKDVAQALARRAGK